MPTVETALVVQNLLGDLVDVGKMGPDPSSVHVPGELRPVRMRRRPVRKLDDRTKRQVTAGLSAVGGAAGAAGLAYAGHDIVRARRAGVKVPLHTKAFLPLEAAGLGGEIMATRILHGDTKRAGQPVAKANIPLGQLLKGRIASLSNTLGLGGAHAAGGARQAQHGAGTAPTGFVRQTPKPTPKGQPRGVVPSSAPGPLSPGQQAAMANGAGARMGLEQFMGTTGGKVTAGAGVAGAGYVYHRGKANGQQQAYYGKADVVDVGIEGTFSKFDDDKKRAYGWASVVTMDGEPVVDRQGDYIGLDDIEEAAYAYVRKSRVAGDMHRRTVDDQPHRAGELIESVVFTPDKCHAMGLPASFAGKWWIGTQIDDDEVWSEVKKGNRTGFSIHGKGLRKDTTLEDIRAGR